MSGSWGCSTSIAAFTWPLIYSGYWWNISKIDHVNCWFEEWSTTLVGCFTRKGLVILYFQIHGDYNISSHHKDSKFTKRGFHSSCHFDVIWCHLIQAATVTGVLYIHCGWDKFQHEKSRWWQLNYFFFTPNLGDMIQYDDHIIQMGWFNHQLERCLFCWKWFWFISVRNIPLTFGGTSIKFHGLCMESLMVWGFIMLT